LFNQTVNCSSRLKINIQITDIFLICIDKHIGISQGLPDESDPKSWLKHVHAKLWDKSTLQEKIFRETTVTFAHFLALENRLNEHNPLRTAVSDKYKVAEVERIKSKFLDEIIAGTINVDDYKGPLRPEFNEINSFFPFKLKYIDLSTSIKVPPTRSPPLILYRQEYDVLSRLLEKKGELARASLGSAIVSGQPGIGESKKSIAVF
jgi:hypothetical protein